MRARIKKECLSFSALGFALIAGPAIAQQGINNNDVVVARPVNVNTAMSPQSVPQVLPSQTYADTLLEVEGASTGVGGSNPGNANTGGVQVQHVTVQASPSAGAGVTSEVTTDSLNRSSLMRNERKRKEMLNDDELMAKIEKGRLEDEIERAKHIEHFQGNLAGAHAGAYANGPLAVETVPVSAAAAGASAQASGNGASAQAYAVAVASDSEVVTTSVKREDDLRRSAFRIAPFIGYTWIADRQSLEFEMTNQGVVGIGLEGVLNQYVSLEGNFAYSRDRMDQNLNPVALGAGAGPFGPTVGINSACAVSGPCSSYGFDSRYAVRNRDNFELSGGAKVGMLLGRVRPFSAIGFGAVLKKYNIDNELVVREAELSGYQRSTNHMLANLGTGMDVSLGRHLSWGARFDYQVILNKSNTAMDGLYRDSSNSYRLTSSLVFTF